MGGKGVKTRTVYVTKPICDNQNVAKNVKDFCKNLHVLYAKNEKSCAFHIKKPYLYGAVLPAKHRKTGRRVGAGEWSGGCPVGADSQAQPQGEGLRPRALGTSGGAQASANAQSSTQLLGRDHLVESFIGMFIGRQAEAWAHSMLPDPPTHALLARLAGLQLEALATAVNIGGMRMGTCTPRQQLAAATPMGPTARSHPILSAHPG